MAYKESLYECLERISKLRKKSEMVAALQKEESYALKTALQAVFDERIIWVLPPGTPPYTPNELVDCEGVLYHEIRKLAYFVDGGAPNLNRAKREMMFIELLEVVDKKDSLLLLALKAKELPWKTITRAIVGEAFPKLLPV